MTGFSRRRLNAEEHVRWTELLGLDGHHPQGPGSSAGQYPGRRVGLVAQSDHRLFDAEPSLVGDAGEPVQDAGDRHDRDAGLGGDVGHDGASRWHVGRHASA